MKKKIKSSQKGFTLLETLVAIFILTLAITGPVYIASVAFRNTIDSRDNISAQYLAEEVVEVMRNRRAVDALTKDKPDSTWVSGLDGNTNGACLNVYGSTDKKCEMKKNPETGADPGGYTFYTCLGDCPNISFDPTEDVVYGQSDVNTVSKFTREFYFERDYLGEADGIKIVVNIKWNDKGRNKIYTLTERLYNVSYRQYFVDEL